MAARMLAIAAPRVLWKWSHQRTPGYWACTVFISSYTCFGVAMPEVSDREISETPTLR